MFCLLLLLFFTNSICLLSISTFSHPHKSQKKKKKAKQTGNQVLFSDPADNWGHRTHHSPQNWRQTRVIMTWEQELRAETPRDLVPEQETSAVTDKVLWAGGSVLADPTLLWVLSQEAINQVITVNIREESPCAPSKGKRKGTNLKCAVALCSS